MNGKRIVMLVTLLFLVLAMPACSMLLPEGPVPSDECRDAMSLFEATQLDKQITSWMARFTDKSAVQPLVDDFCQGVLKGR